MKKRILLLLCALLIASTVLTPLVALAGNAKILIVNVDGARLRNGGDHKRIIASLKKGTRVVYGGTHDGSMYLVRSSSGKKGYIYKRYLSAYGAAPAKKIYAARKKTNVYRHASTSSRRVTRLSAGSTVIVYETRGSWAYIRTLDGKAGYVKKSYLRRS